MVPERPTPDIAQFDEFPAPTVVVGLDGSILALNPAAARLSAVPPEVAVGQKVWSFAPSLATRWAEVLDGSRRHGTYAGTSLVATRCGARNLEFVAAIRGAAEREYVVVTGLDITRHEQDEAQARSREALDAERRVEALGLVAGGIAHEFNNQLVAVLAEASAAHDDPALGVGTHEALRRIEAAANRMAQLTRQLLAFAGRGDIATEPLDPDGLLASTHEQLVRAIAPAATLVLRPGAGPVTIEADRGLLRQVVVNLVVNASEALPEGGGSITVASHVERVDGAAWWTIEVADDGVGMAGVVADRVFEPFFTTKTERHGLGLSAVHGIVRRLGGEVALETALGQGTRFRVRLPLASARPRRARASTRQPAFANLDGTRVLVADDEPSVRRTVCRLLERRGAQVVTAIDGDDAATRLRDGRYDVILLDVMMPGATGYELLPRARALQPDAMLMLMSGYSDHRRGRDDEEEPDLFLEKPFSARVLDGALDRLLERQRRRRR